MHLCRILCVPVRIKIGTNSCLYLDISIKENIENFDPDDLEEYVNSDAEDDSDKTEEINVEDINKQAINVDKDSKVVNENVVSDDEYFDDFFDE